MTIEITAKKVQDAINQGLEQLGATLDEVDVEVLESGGLFKKAKVRMTLEREEKVENAAPAEKQSVSAEKPVSPAPAKAEAQESVKKDREVKQQPQAQKPAKQKQSAPEKPQAQKPRTDAPIQPTPEKESKAEKQPEQKKRAMRPEDEAAAKKALEFVQTVIQKMGFDATVTADASGELVNVSAADGDDSLIIGRHGETLSALSYLAETTARAEKCHINVTVDCNGYRDRRAASLTAMAKRRADECSKKRRKIKLEAMERVDRRTIHNALTGDSRVSTASEGKEPHRYVVIIPR